MNVVQIVDSTMPELDLKVLDEIDTPDIIE